MSGVVFIFSRCESSPRFTTGHIQRISDRLEPDHIRYPAPVVRESQGLLCGIINPCDSLPVLDTSVCLGAFFGPRNNWSSPGAPKPDGCFSLFRHQTDEIEVLTDALGTRSLWYYIDTECFIASSSQRAIIMLAIGAIFLLLSRRPRADCALALAAFGVLVTGVISTWKTPRYGCPGRFRQA